MAQMMRAGVSGAEGLRVAEVPRPVPGAGQVLVKVAAAGMNRADLNAARGAGVATAASLGKPIGMEWAGEVVTTGAGVTGLAEGEAVMCSGSGGYAEYAVADARRCIPLTGSGLTLHEAAVLPLVLMTAHDAVVTNGRLAAGEAVLVQGAASAVGLMAMQIAALRGARVVAGTSGNPGRRDRLAAFGATHALDPASPDLIATVLQATGGAGVDLVIDMVSGDSVNRSMQMAAVRGRMVNVGRLGGTSAAFDFDLHAAKRLDYIGVTFRTRSPDEVAEIVRRMRADLWQPLLEGRLRLPVDRSFALSDAVAAHAHMQSDRHFGKIVLLP